jgi:hypothetical protein
MATLVNALDNYTSKQIGEKGHVEYGWSNNIREQILQFNFQLTRTDEIGVEKLSIILNNLLQTLKDNYDINSTDQVTIEYLIILYKMIGHTRDIIDGKGECALTYMMIYTWYNYYPELAFHALKCLVDPFIILNEKTHQYGSWKDIKYFCNYCLLKNCDTNHPLIQHAIMIVNNQLRNDCSTLAWGLDDISLVAKWVPREKSNKFGKMYQAFACDYFLVYMESAQTDSSKEKAITKCKTEYRKILSTLNKKIDTLQIKQCDRTWADINFQKVTSVSLSKQKKAFLNITKNGKTRYPSDQDRIDCSDNFNEHIQKAVRGEVEMKGKRLGLNDFTKEALNIIDDNSSSNSLQAEIDLLNSQWRDNSTQTGQLGKMIAMVDVSGSMDGDPMNAAIALGIRVAEKSILGKRIMTFSSSPKWINLDESNDFVSMVNKIKVADWGMNTNFESALNMILDAIINTKMSPEDVQDLTLVVLSDMQMDQADKTNSLSSLYDRMKEKYAAAGIRVHNKPYKPPHILFWNLRSTQGFPTLSTQSNASMMSGFSPSLLNLFCDQGVEALQSSTPWTLLERSLQNERYSVLEKPIREILQN